MKTPRLSICIPTLNRGRFIAATLDSIVAQWDDTIEIVIVDGGSTDATPEVVADFVVRYGAARIRYIRETGSGPIEHSNRGFDRDCDRAVKLASGEHCWLFTDDDVIAPGGIDTVQASLSDGDPDLLLVDSEVRDMRLERIFEQHRLWVSNGRDYETSDRDQFLCDAGNSLTFVGGVIVRRRVWIERVDEDYYGSGFIHACVILNGGPPGQSRILNSSLVRIRMGNAAWSARAFDIWMTQWPALIWNLDGYSDAAKARVIAREPWNDPRQLLLYRAYGSFGSRHYRDTVGCKGGKRIRMLGRLILAVPPAIAHIASVTMLALSRQRHGSILYNLLLVARASNPVSRAIGRMVGQTLT